MRTVEFTKENCPHLADIGAISRTTDCYEIRDFDLRTAEDDPAFTMVIVSELGNGDNFKETDDDSIVINEGSHLADFIEYGINNTAPCGWPNYNTASDMSTTAGAGTAGGAVISSVPVLGDLLDVVDQGTVLSKLDYLTCKATVKGNTIDQSYETEDGGTATNPDLSTEIGSWDGEIKYYESFVQSMHQAVVEGYIEENPVETYISQYYEKHPIDTSYEGTIARFSGMTKDQVSATLAFINVANFIAEYEPRSLYPTPQNSDDDALNPSPATRDVVFETYVASVSSIRLNSRKYLSNRHLNYYV